MMGETIRRLMDVEPEVGDALAANAPVVALESTIITHGMPFPQNVETAREVEDVVRENGAVPATIAILDGRIRVGLSGRELDALGKATGVVKASGRDLGAVLARGGSAGTTVSATMLVAAIAGIRVFATGGVGGVHRGAEETFDVSADLSELGRTPVSVVCAGVKSILDIPKTLEYLETQRVPVYAYGTDDFPAFYIRSSGLKADHRFDDIDGLARAIALHTALGTGTGVMVANPIPEADALDPASIDRAITDAVAEATRRGVSRKELTPFLLQRLYEITGGESLKANIALVKNNAAVAAQLAAALAVAG
jgi:pseudouridine-5'-phosphate glycosidase